MRRFALPLAALGALVSAACSMNLPDTVEAYATKSQESRSSNGTDASAFPPAPTSGSDAGVGLGGDAGLGGGGAGDSGGTAPLACPPAPVTGFTPLPWAPPTAAHQKRCTQQQAQMVASCLMTTVGSTPACDSFMTAYANGGCIQCALSSAAAPKRGPIIDDGTGYYTNPAGCVATLDGDVSATGCGAQLEALLECESAACNACKTDQDFGACAAAADEGVCSAYAAGNHCATLYGGTCIGTSPVDEAQKLVLFTCGQ